MDRINIQHAGSYYKTTLNNIKDEIRPDYEVAFEKCEDDAIIEVEETRLWHDCKDVCDVEFSYFDRCEFTDFINDLIPDAESYLVVAKHCTWDGSDGYKITSNKIDCIARDYECSTYVNETTENYVSIIESSHDVPMGSEMLIIPLDEHQLMQLETAEDEWAVIKNIMKETI